jgi:hypothetical protein
MAELITNQELQPILDAVGKRGAQLIRDHIISQKEVTGGSFPALAPSTIADKRGIGKGQNKRKGGGVTSNATKRMIRTGDFYKNAYLYEVKPGEVTFYISSQPHKHDKTEARLQTRKTNKDKGWEIKAKEPKQADFSYRDLAGWQLRGTFDQNKRKANNPGADFFGFSQSNEEELKKMLEKQIAPIVMKNIKNAIIQNANQRK